MLANTITVGTGKSIHWTNGEAALCGADYRNGIVASRKAVKADGATCKRCIKIMAVQVETDHEAALIIADRKADAEAVASADVQHDTQWIDADGVVAQVTRVAAAPFPRVLFRKADGSTGALSLVWFLERFTALPGKEEAHAAALDMEAVRAEFAEPQPVDADGAVKLLAMLGGPETAAEVPNTAEAWEAYAERLKASRDAAEADLAQLLRDLSALADRWQRTAVACNALPEQPWLAVRRVMGRLGR